MWDTLFINKSIAAFLIIGLFFITALEETGLWRSAQQMRFISQIRA